ncbi:hypothetical protein [Algibacter sp. PT7-4]|uniref:hypothetical protein n=1 Tax=Algibacter ulvanivorans TaxID=3400999 RepID=UPI003AAD367B
MKKSFILFLIPAILLSCGKPTKEDNYKKQIKTYFEESMHDPDSYELESFSLLSDETTIPVKILWPAKKKLVKENLSNEIYEKKLDSIIKLYSEIYEQAFIKVRGKNAFGAKTMNRYTAKFENGVLISVED